MNTKAEIRQKYKLLRKSFSENEIDRLSLNLAKVITDNFQLKNNKISVFLSIKKLNEINTQFIINELKKQNSIYVTKSNFSNFEMVHIPFTEKTIININEFGIPEPLDDSETINPIELDVVFVPLLAFNKDGHRIGYGKGFYDRFLSKCSSNCKFIGVSLFENPEEYSEISSSDIKLNYCITPTKCLHFE